MRGGMRRFRSTIVVIAEDDHGAGDGFPEDDLGAGDGFMEDDLKAAEQLMQLRCSGGWQEEQADDDDDDGGDWWGWKRKRPRYRSLSEL
ncbi:hypothetical protein DAI22_04g223300 [Oryza sativa Japonica Group]|nr:hypothetical protein DAI22_04g223300 [Oryza sativa Japonica Group]